MTAITESIFWTLGHGNDDVKIYNVSRLILVRACNIAVYSNRNNTERAKQLGLLTENYKMYVPLVEKFCKYNDRFGNLPNDKLATEWLEEFQNEEKNTPIHLDQSAPYGSN